jgi:hypothetical protein
MQVAQVVDGHEYRARRGFFEMPDHHAAAHLRSAGYGRAWPVAGVPAKGAGHTCSACGFASWFVKCGRCGHDPREAQSDGR